MSSTPKTTLDIEAQTSDSKGQEIKTSFTRDGSKFVWSMHSNYETLPFQEPECYPFGRGQYVSQAYNIDVHEILIDFLDNLIMCPVLISLNFTRSEFRELFQNKGESSRAQRSTTSRDDQDISFSKLLILADHKRKEIAEPEISTWVQEVLNLMDIIDNFHRLPPRISYEKRMQNYCSCSHLREEIGQPCEHLVNNELVEALYLEEKDAQLSEDSEEETTCCIHQEQFRDISCQYCRNLLIKMHNRHILIFPEVPACSGQKTNSFSCTWCLKAFEHLKNLFKKNEDALDKPCDACNFEIMCGILELERQQKLRESSQVRKHSEVPDITNMDTIPNQSNDDLSSEMPSKEFHPFPKDVHTEAFA